MVAGAAASPGNPGSLGRMLIERMPSEGEGYLHSEDLAGLLRSLEEHSLLARLGEI